MYMRRCCGVQYNVVGDAAADAQDATGSQGEGLAAGLYNIYTYVYSDIYIYIYRERDLYIYIYIYVYR